MNLKHDLFVIRDLEGAWVLSNPEGTSMIQAHEKHNSGWVGFADDRQDCAMHCVELIGCHEERFVENFKQQSLALGGKPLGNLCPYCLQSRQACCEVRWVIQPLLMVSVQDCHQ